MEPIKVLLVDDDPGFGNLVCAALTKLGHKTHFQTSLAAIEEIIEQFCPSIIILDVEIGKENGIQKAKKLTYLYPSIPIFFISSHHEDEYIEEGIAAGGFFYLKKPFNVTELDSYIKRHANTQPVTRKIVIGNYLLDPDTKQLLHNDSQPLKITSLEINALKLFATNKNKPVSLELLSKELWGYQYSPDLTPRIYNLISKLRKLFENDKKIWINSVKEGYKLTVL